uniref:Uncharacterized protein n=1 Tax=Vombatus ursinus TaxID=29139 RepID=A0A4X2KZE6_VOMUR
MLEKPSTVPVALPCASCVWNTSLGLGLGWSSRGRGRALPVLRATRSPSISLDASLGPAFFLPRSPSGILAGQGARLGGEGCLTGNQEVPLSDTRCVSWAQSPDPSEPAFSQSRRNGKSEEASSAV